MTLILTIGICLVKGFYNDQLKFKWIPILIANLSIILLVTLDRKSRGNVGEHTHETQVSRGTDRSSVFDGRKRLKERELGSPYGVKGAKSPTSGENK